MKFKKINIKKTQILTAVLVISLIFNLAMAWYLVEWRSACQCMYTDDIDRTKVVVPDEAAAEMIARYSLRTDGSAGPLLGLKDNIEYAAEVTFYERTNEWLVRFIQVPPGQMLDDWAGDMITGVRRDNGRIMLYPGVISIPGYVPDQEMWESRISLRDRKDRSLILKKAKEEFVRNTVGQCRCNDTNEINREWDEYPDKDVAEEIAEACIGMDKTQAEAAYFVETTYDRLHHEWIITFTPKQEGAAPQRVIGIRRDNTVITDYSGL